MLSLANQLHLAGSSGESNDTALSFQRELDLALIVKRNANRVIREGSLKFDIAGLQVAR